MSVEVFGYSERGMINAIVYEMKYGPFHNNCNIGIVAEG